MVRATSVPATLRWAAIAFGAYGLVVIVNATVLQSMSDWEGIAEYPRAIIRSLGVGLVVWGLLRRARWAWWLGLLLTLFWLATGVFGLVIFVSVRTPEADALLPPGFYMTLTATLMLLAVAATLLLLPSSRQAVRPTNSTSV